MLEGKPSRVVSDEKNMDWHAAFGEMHAAKRIKSSLILFMRAAMMQLKLQVMAWNDVKKSVFRIDCTLEGFRETDRKHEIHVDFWDFNPPSNKICKKHVGGIVKKVGFTLFACRNFVVSCMIFYVKGKRLNITWERLKLEFRKWMHRQCSIKDPEV